MTNIRVLRLSVKSSTQIDIEFTSDLSTSITISNISIFPSRESESIIIKSIEINNSTLSIYVRPLIPDLLYEAVLQSTSSQPFGKKGETLIDDGATNHIFFVGQEEENIIRDTLINNIKSQKIYKTEDSLIRDLTNTISKPLLNSYHDAGEAHSDKFVEIKVEDEILIRGSGPTDRFLHEGVFKLLRVGSSLSESTTRSSLSYSEFPSDSISLQQITVTNEEVSNTVNKANKFDGLIITTSKTPIIKVTSVVLIRNSIEYVYDLIQNRYGLKESKYDTDNSYPALDIENNQIRLSDSAVGPSFPFPEGNDVIKVTYIYKKEGRIIDSNSVSITSVVSTKRESVSAVVTTFFLKNAPIIDVNGNVAMSKGVTWLDPNQNFDPLLKHPAFITEIPYSETILPTSPGEWSVNYNNGRVIVVGVNGTGTDGTTTTPPVASYNYKRTFVEGLDYNFYSDLNEIASIPGRNLDQSIESSTINFGYEDTYANGTDFLFTSHIEKLNERIENKIISDIGITTLYGPVKNVFRIFNETTGEIYPISRIDGKNVYFTSITPPVLNDVIREAVEFENVIQDQIVVADVISASGFSIFKVELSKEKIISSTGDGIGVSTNSSLTFSKTNIFSQELYYNRLLSLSSNLLYLSNIGDISKYVVDYEYGYVYVAVALNSSTEIGNASYKHAYIYTKNQHITSVNNVYRSPKANVSNVKTFNLGETNNQTIEVLDLEFIGETSIQVQSDNTIYPSKAPIKVRGIFHIGDLQNSIDPVNFSSGVTIQQDGYVALDSLGVPIIDSGLIIKNSGSYLYIDAEKLNNIVSGSINLSELTNDLTDPLFLKKNYAVIDEGTGIDYFSYGTGSIDAVNNRIILPSSVPLSVVGSFVEGRYRAKLKSSADVFVDYSPGDIFIDYTYLRDEILISYEYGDNVLDWSVSDTLSEGENYYVTYKYGAMRESLRDNFGILTSVDELTVIPDTIDRETYRDFIKGALQSFMKGPTIPAIKQIVSEVTEVDPEIVESIFQEWVLGRDYLNLEKMQLKGLNNITQTPTFVPGKFNNGILVKNNQTLTIPASSNLRFAEGTWEAFIIPHWSGIYNDSELTFDLKFDGYQKTEKVYIGASNLHPETIPFTLSRFDTISLGHPTGLHHYNGTFIWFDTNLNKWRLRVRAPISELRQFTGTITTNGQFNNVKEAIEFDGYYDSYGGPAINEINDYLTSTNYKINYDFTVDGYDTLNFTLDDYGSGTYAGFDGIDFLSDKFHYLLDTGYSKSRERLSLFKDGKGFLRFRIYDHNGHIKNISKNIKDWDYGSTHHIATSWKIGTIEQRDEVHLFVDGYEASNTYRFSGPFTADGYFLDSASEILVSSALNPTIGNYDLVTTAGSDIVTSLAHDFITEGVSIGDSFIILDDTVDGDTTLTGVYIKIVSNHSLQLEDISHNPFYTTLSLTNVKYTINQKNIATSTDPNIEKVRVFAQTLGGSEFELFSPETQHPDYSFKRDGYQDYIVLNNGISIGSDIYLRSYGLTQERCKQTVHIWPNNTNLIQTIMPQPTSVSKINITSIIVQRTLVDASTFGIIATTIGSHIIKLSGSLSYCQPSKTLHRLKVIVRGNNFDISKTNEVKITGYVYDGGGGSVIKTDTVSFIEPGHQLTDHIFVKILNVYVDFAPEDQTKPTCSVEIRENKSITESCDGYSADGYEPAVVYLSVLEELGTHGSVISGQNTLTDIDGYSFIENDIGKTVLITNPSTLVSVRVITDVALDSSGVVKNSNTITLSGSPWVATSSIVEWKMLNTSYSDSGFANGLITLEKKNSGGLPYYLTSCTYEVDFPAYLIIPWVNIPEKLYIGSDIFGKNQASAVIDEMRILNEISDDTGNGETTLSSERSITTDSLAIREFTKTSQTLGLFHFDDLTNEADFLSSYDQTIFQSENSVNSEFGQSAIFNRINGGLDLSNTAIFQNDAGVVEFWVNPIVDTYNDPTNRYYIDLSTEQTIEADVLSPLVVKLSIRARSISSVIINGSLTNYYTGGNLSTDGVTITLGQPIPAGVLTVSVIFVPINSQGDRFSILKDENGILQLFVSASEIDYQISIPVFWKRNTWHKIYAGWNLNNEDNQDRLVFIVDGFERGIIRYGTGFSYGSGYLYGTPTVFGSNKVGTTMSRNILADINLMDIFNSVHIGNDFTGQYPAMAKMDNIRFSNSFRSLKYLGGTGAGSLLGQDLTYSSNLNTVLPVISDAFTTLLLNFNNNEEIVDLTQIHDASSGIFDFFVKIFDSFNKIPGVDSRELLVTLINRLKPSHTRAFISYIDD